MDLEELNLIGQQEDNIDWVLWVQQVRAELVATMAAGTKLVPKIPETEEVKGSQVVQKRWPTQIPFQCWIDPEVLNLDSGVRD